MIYIFNTNTLFLVCAGIFCGVGLYLPTGSKDLGINIGIAVATVLDFVFRLGNKEESPPLFHHKTGGHIWFAPVWTLGLVALLTNLIIWLISP